MVARITKEEFINKALEKHGDKYDYTDSLFVNMTTKISILCKEHNISFRQKPSQHVRSTGCKTCSYSNRHESTRKTLQDFVVEATLLHEDKYDYSEFNYVNNKTLGTIKCKSCLNTWESNPNNHLSNKTGCPNCSDNSIYTKEYYINNNIPNHTCYLYVITFVSEEESFIKIGLTKNTDINKRFKDAIYKKYSKDINLYYKTDFFNAFELEQYVLTKFSSYSYLPKESFKGRTECLDIKILNEVIQDLNSVTLNGNIHDKLI